MRQLRPLLLQKADHRANIDLLTIIQLGKPLTEFVSVLDRPEHGHMYACNGILVKSHSKRRPHLLAEVRATVETPSKMPRCGEYATRCPQPLRGLPRHRRRLGSAKRREGAGTPEQLPAASSKTSRTMTTRRTGTATGFPPVAARLPQDGPERHAADVRDTIAKRLFDQAVPLQQ